MVFRQAAILGTLAGALVLAAGALAAPTVYPRGVTIHEEGVAEGHVLFGGRDGLVHLVDSNGTEVHAWAFPCAFSYAVRPVGNGHVLGKSCGNLVELDWDGTVVWQLAPPDGATIHSDWERLPNGNTLVLCQRTIHDPSISANDVVDDFILEVSPAGDVVWEWHLVDHFDELGFSQARIDFIYDRGGDWSHATAVSKIPDNTSHTNPWFAPGNIILSLRHQNTIAFIDPSTSAVVYVITDAYPGPQATHMIPGDLPGADSILVFISGFAGEWLPFGTISPLVNNRYHSRVKAFDPSSNQTTFRYWDADVGIVEGTLFSHVGGGAQRLANGNTLITEADFGRIFEVTTSLDTVWEYISPYSDAGNSNEVYRAYKVPLDWAGSFFMSDLVVSMGEGPGGVQRGGSLQYTIQVENVGSDPGVGVELATTTPVGATFQSISVPAGWDCTTPVVDGTGPITCRAPSLGAGAAVAFTIVVEVDPCDGDGTAITGTATASSSGSDTTPADNSTTIEITPRDRTAPPVTASRGPRD